MPAVLPLMSFLVIHRFYFSYQTKNCHEKNELRRAEHSRAADIREERRDKKTTRSKEEGEETNKKKKNEEENEEEEEQNKENREGTIERDGVYEYKLWIIILA